MYRKRHVSFFDVILSAMTSAVLSLIFWQELDPRLVIFFVLAVGIAQIFIVLRWRMTIACAKCGFDPVLYKRKPDLAAARVKSHYKTRMEDPMSVFSPPPKLPALVKSKIQQSVSR